MKISTRSWHYRLLDLFDFTHPRNLCGYFWKVVFTVTLVVPFWFIAGLIGAIVLSSPAWQFLVDLPPRSMVTAGGIVDALILSGFLIYLITERRYEERLARRLRGEDPYVPTKPREPSLLREWLRAKHEKVCPTLEFDW